MKNYFLLMLILFSLFFPACEKIVENADIPVQQPKLVVHCYISPEDTMIKAYVYLSVPIFTYYNVDNYTPVNNATVKISDYSSEVQLLFDGQEKYVSNTAVFPILAGSSYKLSVSAPGFESVEATCKVPLLKNQTLHLLSVDSVKTDEYNTEYKYKTEFADFQGLGNYYRIGGDIISVYVDEYGNLIDTVYNSLYPKYTQEYFSDKNIDGQNILSELNYWNYSYEDNGYGSEKIIGIKLYLLSTDEHYYMYHKSLSNYTGDDPFSEPTIVYSNIQNGLGVFGAYLKHTVEYNLPD